MNAMEIDVMDVETMEALIADSQLVVEPSELTDPGIGKSEISLTVLGVIVWV